jgi:hypothetical protein
MSWLADSQNRMHHCDTEAEATHLEKKKKMRYDPNTPVITF